MVAVRSSTLFAVVSGPPASGKSTLASVLAGELGLPLVTKDTIKDALMSVLPVPDVETSRQLRRAAVAVMLAVAAQALRGAVIESNFYRSVAVEDLRRLPGTVVEVFCRCDRELARARYQSRAGSRHAGHFDSIRTAEELWNDEVAEPVPAGGRSWKSRPTSLSTSPKSSASFEALPTRVELDRRPNARCLGVSASPRVPFRSVQVVSEERYRFTPGVPDGGPVAAPVAAEVVQPRSEP